MTSSLLANSCYTQCMTTVHKFPVSKLPAELREGFSDADFVTVQVSRDTDVLPGYTCEEIDALLEPTQGQIERGDYTTCSTPDDHDAFFKTIKTRALASNSTQ
ncbi:hypothetical protein GCM10009069_20300 [Algimonas arctica]|uniref:Uncharacterized protein n=1 Tax=Algimonas arctica TaxID=1479486 RepID=A0A8J3CR49_9PROT|nr:hypothetical protein [Algimonas arctica]GHA97202.1 hypothetical protein GCM10009069_20300 [Algimonas arctica]